MSKLPVILEIEVNKQFEEANISGAKKEKLLKALPKLYAKKTVRPAEAVGTMAAQSIGEPTTQGALRTFHYAGALSVAGGLDRARELLGMARTIKTPQMEIYLLPKFGKSKAESNAFIAQLIERKLNDVSVVKKVLKTKEAIITLNKKLITKYALNIDEIAAKIEKAAKVEPKIKGNVITVVFDEKNMKKLVTIMDKLKKLTIAGVKGITHAVLADYKYKETGEYLIVTRGSNLKGVMKFEKVDPKRIFTNDIREVEDVLGVEAGRAALLEELHKVYSKDMYVDQRHLKLFADLLSFNGVLKAVGRTGISGSKRSVLARVSFEETSKNLFNAVLYGEEEVFAGVAENIIAGKIINVGTGTVKVVMK